MTDLKSYFEKLFTLDEYTPEKIIERLAEGIYWNGYYKQYWRFKPNDYIWVFVQHEVCGLWGGWITDSTGYDIAKFDTIEDARIGFLEYVIANTDFKDVDTDKYITIDEIPPPNEKTTPARDTDAV